MSQAHIDTSHPSRASDNRIEAHSGPGLGVLLRRAREARGLSTAELGRRLNLAAATVEALEREDLQALPGAVYVRGYLRRLATELGIDETELQGAYARIAGTAETALLRPAVYAEPMGSPGRRRALPFLLLVIVALGVLVAGIYGLRLLPGGWKQAGDDDGIRAVSPLPGAVPALPQESMPLPPPPLPEVTSGATSGDVPAIAPVVGEVVPAPPQEAQPASPPVEPAPALELQTRSAESWVQVRDASGKILLEEVLRPGTRRLVDGARPLQVRIGNAAATSLVLDGKVVDLSPHTRPSGTAYIAALGG